MNSGTSIAGKSGKSTGIRIIVELSDDLKEIRAVFPPGRGEEEDQRIEQFFREKFLDQTSD